MECVGMLEHELVGGERDEKEGRDKKSKEGQRRGQKKSNDKRLILQRMSVAAQIRTGGKQ